MSDETPPEPQSKADEFAKQAEQASTGLLREWMALPPSLSFTFAASVYPSIPGITMSEIMMSGAVSVVESQSHAVSPESASNSIVICILSQ